MTHTNIVVIELKNWHGKLLESDGEKWYVDGECRDTSPVVKANLNAKKLASLMKQKLGPDKTPFVSSYVVMHGNIDKMNLTEAEERSVLTMQEFLSFRFNDCYKQYFWGRPALCQLPVKRVKLLSGRTPLSTPTTALNRVSSRSSKRLIRTVHWLAM